MATPLFYLRRFRWFWRLTRWLDWPVTVSVPGLTHRLYLRLGPNLSLKVCIGRGEAQERAFFLRVAEAMEAQHLWDVGANIGLYGYCFLQTRPSATALLIEPDPANLRCLQLTQTKAKQGRATLIGVAVGAEDGRAAFLPDPLTGATGQLASVKTESFVQRHHGFSAPAFEIDVRRLDSLLQSFPAPDLVKIDIEGAEFSALQGAKHLLATRRPVIFLEISAPIAPTAALLTDAGYYLYDWRSQKAAPEGSFMTLAIPAERLGSLSHLLKE